HARMHGRAKDNCQFACEDDPDGLDVKTMDGKPFMAMNGVQTLSDSHATTAHQTKALHAAGVGALRLSPQSQGFSTLCAQYRDLLDEKITGGALIAALKQDTPDVRLSDGFLTGARGVDMSPEMA
ncbi:MAG: U32 family peptidase, partial [Shimia sp.]|nr:U32 family peptidase [Shimia sp.]